MNLRALRDPAVSGALVMGVGVIVFALVSLPSLLSFMTFAFEDPGGVLWLDRLLEKGLRPTREFTYSYGPLPLLVADVWFALVGRSPYALCAAMVLIALVTAQLSLRCVLGIASNWWGVLVLASALPSYPWITSPSLAHALEAMLLAGACNALVRGRFAQSLAWSGLAVLTKPSIGYVLGFCGVAALVLTCWHDRQWRSALRGVIAAAALVVLVLCVSMLRFGAAETCSMLFPTQGRALYQALQLGFFNEGGRGFWHPAGRNLAFYIGTPTGGWLLLTVLLATLSLRAAYRIVLARHRDTRSAAADIFFLSCGAAHAAFVLFAFGNAWSWGYYFGLLVLPAAAWAASLQQRGRNRIAAAAMALVLLTGSRTWVAGKLDKLRSVVFSDRYGLFFDRSEMNDWENLLEQIGRESDGSIAVISMAGAISLLDSHFSQPDYWFLLKGWDHPKARAQIKTAAQNAETLVTYENHPGWEPIRWMGLESETQGFTETAVFGKVHLWRKSAEGTTTRRGQP